MTQYAYTYITITQLDTDTHILYTSTSTVCTRVLYVSDDQYLVSIDDAFQKDAWTTTTTTMYDETRTST